ncbi:MAG: serine hydrolase [Gemmatimonadaceae bacterium]
MHRTVLIATIALVAAQQVAGQPTAKAAPAAGLQRLLEGELGRFPGKAGVWVKHLTSGEEVGVLADETFNSASVIKIPLLLLAFQMADRGELALAQRIPVGPADVRGGSGILRYHDAGLQPTLRDVLLQMIITSDNTATDLAIARVGGTAQVNAWLRKSGYGETLKLNQTTGELFAKYGALPQGANRDEKTNTDRSYWLGEMTPRATGLMLEAIQRCSDGTAAAPSIATQASCTDMMRMMRAQQSGARRLPHFVTVPVAHKTGDFPPVLANDVGIIFARSGPIVVAFFANAIEGPYGEAEDRIGRVAQLIVAYFDGAR